MAVSNGCSKVLVLQSHSLSNEREGKERGEREPERAREREMERDGERWREMEIDGEQERESMREGEGEIESEREKERQRHAERERESERERERARESERERERTRESERERDGERDRQSDRPDMQTEMGGDFAREPTHREIKQDVIRKVHLKIELDEASLPAATLAMYQSHCYGTLLDTQWISSSPAITRLHRHITGSIG